MEIKPHGKKQLAFGVWHNEQLQIVLNTKAEAEAWVKEKGSVAAKKVEAE